MVGDPAAFALAPCGNPILAQRSAPEAGIGRCHYMSPYVTVRDRADLLLTETGIVLR